MLRIGEDKWAHYERFRTHSEWVRVLNKSLVDCDFISHIFSWHNSPEGWEFWSDYSRFGHKEGEVLIRGWLKVLNPKPFVKEEWM